MFRVSNVGRAIGASAGNGPNNAGGQRGVGKQTTPARSKKCQIESFPHPSGNLICRDLARLGLYMHSVPGRRSRARALLPTVTQ